MKKLKVLRTGSKIGVGKQRFDVLVLYKRLHDFNGVPKMESCIGKSRMVAI